MFVRGAKVVSSELKVYFSLGICTYRPDYLNWTRKLHIVHTSRVTTLVYPQSQLKCTACVRSASVIHKSDHPRCCFQISPDEELKICSEVLRHNRIVLNSFIKWYISFGSGR